MFAVKFTSFFANGANHLHCENVEQKVAVRLFHLKHLGIEIVLCIKCSLSIQTPKVAILKHVPPLEVSRCR